MEQNVKNFDREVERMMNEHQVPPPFGAWNRIAAELDAVPAAGIPSPATPLIPRGAIAGFITGALMIGLASLTAFMVTNRNAAKPAPIAAMQPAARVIAVNTGPVANSPAVMASQKITEAVAIVKHHHTVAKQQPQAAFANTKPEQAVTAVETPASLKSNMVDVGMTDKTVSSITPTTETYYFPAIDMPDKNQVKRVTTKDKQPDMAKTAVDDDDDKKVQTKDQKVKAPKRRRSRAWNYGHINK